MAKRRGKKEGTIYQRADGRWTAMVDCGYKQGRRQRKSLYGTTRKEVADKLTKAIRDQQLGLPVALERQKVSDFLAGWLEQKKGSIRYKTWNSYEQVIRVHLSPALGRHELSKLAPQHIQELISELGKQDLSPRSTQNVRAVLRAALNVAVKWGLIVRNPAVLIDVPRSVKRPVEPFSVEEVPLLLTAFEQERLGSLYLLCMAHGLRQGEALGLQWANVDLQSATLTVKHALQWQKKEPVLVETKTPKSRRSISLSGEVVSALRRHRVAQQEARLLAGSRWNNQLDLVFTTRTGRPLDGVNVTRDFQRMLKNAGLPKKRFHDLRHTAASLLLFKKVQPKVVSDVLGHGEIRTTLDLYSHVMPVMMREAADEMENLLTSSRAKK